ncbi:MAG: hypothetical protein NTZ17_02415 [Phycisphaerae bacterium]|nr:hypothetical protein [Phycisphaerae bacterium]
MLFDFRDPMLLSGAFGEVQVGEFAVVSERGGVAGSRGLALVVEEAQGPLVAVLLAAGPPFLLVLEPADTDELRRAALLRPLVAGVLLLGAHAELTPGVVQAVVVDKDSLWRNHGFLCFRDGKSRLILVP